MDGSEHKIMQGRGEAGVALVLVIGLISVITTVAVVVLILVNQAGQRVHNEVSARQGESLARSVFETIMADLGDEMEKGAVTKMEYGLDNGRTLRVFELMGEGVDRRGGMRVTRSLLPGVPWDTALVKQSNGGQPFHTWPEGASLRGSGVSSSEGASSISPELWGYPALMPGGFQFSVATVPQWIYVARDGRERTGWDDGMRVSGSGGENEDFVVGRYAYNLYETSGLLDINVAGYSSVAGPGVERVGGKGSLVFADLSVLPGLAAADVDLMVGWRHRWNAEVDMAEEYLRLSEGTGWRRMFANDNVFLGRKDMLDFWEANNLPFEALPYLTHFSRDLDAPSYRPDPNRPRILRVAGQGGNDAHGLDDVVNPDLRAFDGERQRLLVDRRFPLERLKWVATPTGSGPLDAEVAEKAERYFGLRWEGTFWEYVHARPNGDLYTLQDVPADREPNFFELLRAVVLSGSLGRQFGARGHDSLDQQYSMHRIGGVDGSINLNIMELGACIIDQFDEDSFPTAIRVGDALTGYFVYGKEDVPYMQRLSAIPFRARQWPKEGPGAVKVYNSWNQEAVNSEAYEVSMVLQPMLWRLHQPVDDYVGPTNFRIRPEHLDATGGGSMFWFRTGWDMPNQTNTGVKSGKPNLDNNINRPLIGNYSYWNAPNYRDTHPELFPKTFDGSEFMDVVVPHGSHAFREPQAVHSLEHAQIAGYQIPTGSVPGRVPLNDAVPGHLRSLGFPASFDNMAGFLVGRALTARREPGGSGGRLSFGYFRGDPIEVRMEYQAPDGSWRPYQRAEFTYKSNWSSHFDFGGDDWQNEMWYWSSYLVDPRTARFGGLATTMRHGMKPTQMTIHPQMTWPEGSSIMFGKQRTEGVRPGWTGPAVNTGWSFNDGIFWWEPFNAAAGVENDQAAWNDQFFFAYRDPDEVMRPGMSANNEYPGQFVGNPMARRYSISNTGQLTPNDPVSGRPKVLNRSFRSVAEIAHAFRGTPWRDIDFLHAGSADAGLLDVFTLYEDPEEELNVGSEVEVGPAPVVAGRVNLNSASPEVIAALLKGTARTEGSYLSEVEALQLGQTFVQAVRGETSGFGPLVSKADLVSRANEAMNGSYSGLVKTLSDQFGSATDRSINYRREAVVRGLSDGTTVRAWTFMLDLVVQSGRFPPTASGMEDFNSFAERRYWVHFSVDRITGRLLDMQWERVAF